jgi:hypothetical protein
MKPDKTKPNDTCHGLTKRELFAAVIMAGMYADSSMTGRASNYAWEACNAADELIAELNKRREEGR